MTKFKDLDEDQRNAFVTLANLSLEKRVEEHVRYANEVIKLLILSNGASIALLGSFMGAFVESEQGIQNWISPIWRFFAGCVLASLIYAVLNSVSDKAVQHVSQQLISFYLNKMDIESVTGYGLNAFGMWAVRILMMASFLCFVWGVYLSIEALQTFHG